MRKGIFIVSAALLVLSGALFVSPAALAGCSSCALHSEKAAAKAPQAPCCAGKAKAECSSCASKRAAGVTRAVHPISNGVVLVYTADSDAGIAQVRHAAAVGCGASCSHGFASLDKAEHTGCSVTKKALYAKAERAHSGCKSKAPSVADVNREVIQTPNGAIVVLTTEKPAGIEALHAWASEQGADKPSTRASLN